MSARQQRAGRPAGGRPASTAPIEVERHTGTGGLLPFLCAATAVRLIGIGSAAIWFDEAISRYRARVSLPDYLRYVSDYTGTNLWELILRPFAYGPDWLLRVPGLVASVVAVWIAWRVMDELAFTRAQRLTAAIPLVLLPGLLWQAQDARYYAALSAIYMAALWFAVRRRPIGLVACMGLLPYIQPVGVAYAFGGLVVAWISGMGVVKCLMLGGMAVLSWLPRLYQILSTQALPGLRAMGATQAGNTEFWLSQVTPLYAIDQTAQAFVVDTLPVAGRLLFVLVLLGILALGLARIAEQTACTAFAGAFVPLAALLAVGIVQPVYFYRPVQPIAIAFCLLAGCVLAPPTGWFAKILLASGSALLLISISNWNPSARGGYIDRGADVISRNWHRGDQIYYASLTVAMPFRHYLPNRESCLIPNNGMGELPPALRVMDDCTNLTTAGGWLVWPRDPTLDKDVQRTLENMVRDTLPSWRSDMAWQFAPIEIYYLP